MLRRTRDVPITAEDFVLMLKGELDWDDVARCLGITQSSFEFHMSSKETVFYRFPNNEAWEAHQDKVFVDPGALHRYMKANCPRRVRLLIAAKALMAIENPDGDWRELVPFYVFKRLESSSP